VSVGHILSALVNSNRFSLLVGSTGTGKSSIVRQLVADILPEQLYHSLHLTLSSHSTAGNTQQLIEAKLERRDACTLGPMGGADKHLLVYIDDINLPRDDTSSSPRVIELLRQWAGYRGWYDQKTSQFNHIAQTHMIAAMTPGGFGGQSLSDRFVRHMYPIALAPHSTAVLNRIFSTLLSTFLHERVNEGKIIVDSVLNLRMHIVAAAVDLHQSVCSRFRPTVAAPQIVFDLKDLSRVVLGITNASFTSIKEQKDLVRLWTHESFREYSDRFSVDGDLQLFKSLVAKQLSSHFKMNPNDMLETKDPLWFTDFGYMGAKVLYFVAVQAHLSRLLRIRASTHMLPSPRHSRTRSPSSWMNTTDKRPSDPCRLSCSRMLLSTSSASHV
jgi:dynein heavy chain